MHMVGDGDRDGVHLPYDLTEHLAIVFEAGNVGVLIVSRAGSSVVDIAESDQVLILVAGDMSPAAATGSNLGDIKLSVRRWRLSSRPSWGGS